MQLSPERLAQHLQQKLAPIYFISGDEPLQQMECADAVRKLAREKGFGDRQVHTVDKDFKWGQLLESIGSLSLFAEQRLIELRLPTGKPGKEGAQVLKEYAASPPSDVLLLIVAGKLERASKNSAWFKALDQSAAIVQVWPLNPAQLKQWLAKRASAIGIRLSSEGLNILIERTEGNLLAASQELSKLSLLYSESAVDAEQLARAVADSARFSIYDLSDAALLGDQTRALRILHGLQEEGEEPVLILWALSREIRSLAQITHLAASGMSHGAALQKSGVWKQRVPLVQNALRRKLDWQQVLQQAAKLDRLIKGAEQGDQWLALEELILAICNKPLFKAA